MSLRSVIRLLCAVGPLVVCLRPVAVAAQKHAVLVVLTHRDDNVAIAPLLAKYAAEGHTVHFAMFTGVQDDTGEPGSPTREELMCASRALGVKETFVMRARAGDANATARRVERAEEKTVAERLIEIINETKPTVIITWGPDGLTGHPLHILVGNVVTRVFQQQALLKHKPRKLYYIAYPETGLPDTRLPFGVLAAGSDRGEALAGPFGTVSDIFNHHEGRRPPPPEPNTSGDSLSHDPQGRVEQGVAARVVREARDDTRRHGFPAARDARLRRPRDRYFRGFMTASTLYQRARDNDVPPTSLQRPSRAGARTMCPA
ncbi:MAG: PIG-L family deacetylase [Vicinamibacterales bacterium]